MGKVKSYLKYIISLLIAGSLLWYVFKDFDLVTFTSKLKEVDYRWIALAICIFFVSHSLRAYRWNILLNPLGYRHLTTFRTLLAVMVGYFANLIIPRMGEVSRCGILKKTDDIPITTSLGTVVAERIIDLFCLFTAMLMLFVFEFARLNDFIFSFLGEKLNALEQNIFAIYIMLGIVAILLLLFLVLRNTISKKLRHNTWLIKIRNVGRELLKGLTSVSRLENKTGFWLSTISIWLCYYMMSFVVFFALPETSNLGWEAGLAVLVMGSLGMAAPVQGGFGTFHALVSGVLLLYSVAEQEGVLFATLIHSMQTISFIIFGGISFFIASVLSTKRAKKLTTT
ncbi:lysylphosphatidylglycerol synthase transmembrane domain-containing protein [Catalinimonas niigatensis]|uniref:lysylphosphatidylglycerol synthase transmembrane domain-containing protein n=1 Tax=Catalinimonas niigatensis TaxID=1397264 RepID=UPI0026666CDC|nr:lysylphosphatidylglycerol synthase transmembrane domain-containing protein [Catalinimonas niigatensis]WPP48211.1 lysylphosphatidylglycerol synthase transmembrane domain-containing protein [Catalinimonas niigatensis]